jgi:hypothetical protein
MEIFSIQDRREGFIGALIPGLRLGVWIKEQQCA